MENQDALFFTYDEKTKTIYCQGHWTLRTLNNLKKKLQQADFSLLERGFECIDGSSLEALDSAGAWVLIQWVLSPFFSTPVRFAHFVSNQQQLIHIIMQSSSLATEGFKHEVPCSLLAKIGKSFLKSYAVGVQFLAFLGETSVTVVTALKSPLLLPWRSMSKAIETMGFYAVPLIALLSFLIGMVLAYQMGLQLKDYGATIYVVNGLGASILREFSPLITAIVMAARSGCALTAQLGIMRIRQEMDALATLGLSSHRLLVVPAVFGFCVSLPLLAICSMLFAIGGGMWVSHFLWGITYYHFLDQFYHAIPVRLYWTGLIKMPVFGLVISLIACFQGFQASGSAASVGQKTTASVVQSIFFIILLDAAFCVLFQWLHL